MIWILLGLGVVIAVVIYDVTQRKHAILRNFPIVGHFRYVLESVGPELRQYIVTDNNEERPFSRDQRRWVYASSKHQNNYFGFGTDNDLEQSPSYIIVKKDLVRLMMTTGRGVDFITVDGGEGGTGAAPLVFADHVALPFKIGFSRVFRVLADEGVHTRVVLIGSGKLGFPDVGLLAMALGCDMINVAREAMLSLGCIQAQRCHTGHCPTGVATQNPWLMRGLDPTYKAARFANYVVTLRKEILQLSHACGHAHPSLVTLDSFDILDPGMGARSARDVFAYRPDDGVKSPLERAEIEMLMGDGQNAAAAMV